MGVAVAVLLVGCGGGDDATTGDESTAASQQEKPQEDLANLQVTLESRANAEDSSVLLGDRLGYFADAGLNIYVLGPASPSLALGYADQGTDIVLSPLPQVVMAQEEGESVVAVGTVIPEATMSMISLPQSGIKEIADLKGKKIGTPGLSWNEEALRVVLEKAGLTLSDVKLSEVAYTDDLVSKLERGNIDAIFGGSWNVEGAALEAKGLNPVITKATDLGIPEFDELVFTAKPGRYAKKPELLEGFLEAAYRGAAAVKEDPAAGGQAVVDKSLEFVSPKEGEAGAEATAPLYAETATIDRKRAAKLIDWMYQEGMIKRKIPVSKLIEEGGASKPSKP
ncbi:MAG TPA: ABC transporter substrate-binding protein [Solirubrobacterales bacterium]|nr:ABC transporter substrate-binding protein [Solirubrobacterales bacterium]